MRQIISWLIVLSMFFFLSIARADPSTQPAQPVLHFVDQITMRMPSGREIVFGPGFFLPDDKWQALDREVTRLQDAETALTAENNALKASPPVKSVRVALVCLGLGALAGAATVFALTR